MNNGKSEGILELQCGCLDCTLNDRSRHEQGFGLCQSDTVNINSKGVCKSYCADFIFIAYNKKYQSDYGDRKESTEAILNLIRGIDEIFGVEKDEL
jgi:hypothetical protein